jgi:hypothetical protein
MTLTESQRRLVIVRRLREICDRDRSCFSSPTTVFLTHRCLMAVRLTDCDCDHTLIPERQSRLRGRGL